MDMFYERNFNQKSLETVSLMKKLYFRGNKLLSSFIHLMINRLNKQNVAEISYEIVKN